MDTVTDAILVVTTDTVPNCVVVQTRGEPIISRQDFQSLDHLLPRALQDLREQAEALGANAVVGVGFSTFNAAGSGTFGLLAFGTPVVVRHDCQSQH